MGRWRIACTLVLVLLALVFPCALVGTVDPSAWPGSETFLRQGTLAKTTFLLVGLTLALAVPAGVCLAVLLERTDLPGRHLLAALLLGSLFVPLPLFTSAWQFVLARTWIAEPVWTPWVRGLVAAAWLHAVAGLPWVVLLTSWGLRSVERDLEDDGRLLLGPAGVLWHISFPRCAASIVAAALCVALQTANEITVTDVMQVRTTAEEVYTQFVTPEPGTGDPLARAVTASLGQMLLCVALILFLARHAERFLPAGGAQMRTPLIVPLGRWRWPLALVLGSALAGITAIPVAGLVWRAGLSGLPPAWSLRSLIEQLSRTYATDGVKIAVSLAVAATAGVVCAAVALVACWLAREARWFRITLLFLSAITWATPGPVIGLGVKGLFRVLLDAAGWPAPLASVLWYGPSYFPLLWVYVVRFLPFATAFLWPLVRLIPKDLFEAARLDGAGPRQELLRIVTPNLASASARAALVVTVLALGELSAGKLVSTPGAESYAEMIFSQMHYGVTSDLAARCLLLLFMVLGGAILVRLARVQS